jgi:hypothetical protein
MSTLKEVDRARPRLVYRTRSEELARRRTPIEHGADFDRAGDLSLSAFTRTVKEAGGIDGFFDVTDRACRIPAEQRVGIALMLDQVDVLRRCLATDTPWQALVGAFPALLGGRAARSRVAGCRRTGRPLYHHRRHVPCVRR